MNRPKPLVSCIMPTGNRHRFVSKAIEYFCRQDYPCKELIVVDDGEESVSSWATSDPRIRYVNPGYQLTLGTKRNLACQEANGEIIVHWDDDDWYADWRITYQVKQLLEERVDICGTSKVFHYDSIARQGWVYKYLNSMKQRWVAGNSLCYWKSLWQRNPFLNINQGEDVFFLWSNEPKKVFSVPRADFMIALIHPGNTSQKRPGLGWVRCSESRIQRMFGRDWAYYQHLFPVQSENPVKTASLQPKIMPAGPRPLVSCIMPTYNRRRFIPRAIQYFLRQDYPNLELVIVDDGEDRIKDIIPPDPRIRYFELPRKFSVGIKRNLACSLTRGEIILFWDDDDWYGPSRVSYQVEPLIKKQADLTAFGRTLMFSLQDLHFWLCSENLQERMFVNGVFCGTLAFWKKIWDAGIRFPDDWLAEDAAFMRAAIKKGARLNKLENYQHFIYLRHSNNTWDFEPGKHIDDHSWERVNQPEYFPREDLEFYANLTQVQAA